jgi:hypothetical protein
MQKLAKKKSFLQTEKRQRREKRGAKSGKR